MALTPKQEKFCLKYIEIGNATEAYRQIYNCERMKPETIKRSAKELLDNRNITATIEKLRQEAKERHGITVDDIIAEYEEARLLAKSLEKPSAMVSATSGKARVLGYDKLIVGGDKDNPVTMNHNLGAPAATVEEIKKLLDAEKSGDRIM